AASGAADSAGEGSGGGEGWATGGSRGGLQGGGGGGGRGGGSGHGPPFCHVPAGGQAQAGRQSHCPGAVIVAACAHAWWSWSRARERICRPCWKRALTRPTART